MYAADALSLVENFPDIIARFDLDSRCVYVNAQFEVAYKISRTNILNKTYEEMHFLNSATSEWMSSIEKVLHSECEDVFEFTLSNVQEKKYYRARLVPEFNVDRILIYVLVVAHDISEIRQSELALRENEKLVSGIIKNTPGMVFQCTIYSDDRHLDFTYISDGSMLLFGLTPAEIMSNSQLIEKKFIESDQKTFLCSMHKALKSMEVWNWDGRTVLNDGNTKWINCRATPRYSDSGNVIWEGVMLNVTISKQTEQQLIDSKQELRNLAAHTESVREGDRKIIAREIHDDLGQALTVLRMNLSLLKINFGPENPALIECIQSMKIDLDKTIKIMRHVTSTLRPVALDLGLTAGLEWLVEELTKNTRIKCHLQSNLHENDTMDDIRATTLFRIVQESLTNIVKHAEATEVIISIELEELEQGNFVRLKIKDNGKGFTLNAKTKKNSFGLIGIHERALILRGIAEIYSVPGEGTVVDVSIPLVTSMRS